MKKVQILNENGQFIGTIGTDCKPNFDKVSEVTRQENTLFVPQGLTGAQLASWLKREKTKQASKQVSEVSEVSEVNKVQTNVILLTIVTQICSIETRIYTQKKVSNPIYEGQANFSQLTKGVFFKKTKDAKNIFEFLGKDRKCGYFYRNINDFCHYTYCKKNSVVFVGFEF